MALGTTTTAVLLGLGGAAAGVGASKLMAPKGGSAMSSPAPMPQAPGLSDASAKAENIVSKKRAAMSKSIYTSPLGVSGEAQIAKKTLLGQ